MRRSTQSLIVKSNGRFLAHDTCERVVHLGVFHWVFSKELYFIEEIIREDLNNDSYKESSCSKCNADEVFIQIELTNTDVLTTVGNHEKLYHKSRYYYKPEESVVEETDEHVDLKFV